jgi:ubiquinone/menaquinone biosynthesis C-methylase UbiE
MDKFPENSNILARKNSGYARNWEGDEQDKEFLLNEIKRVFEELGRSFEGTRVLEVGSGSGSLLGYLKKEGIDCVGVDIRPRGDSNSNQVKARIENLPFQDETFDFVLSSQVFDPVLYKQDQELMLMEIYRVLKPNGIYYGAIEDLAVDLPEGLEYLKNDPFQKVIRKK